MTRTFISRRPMYEIIEEDDMKPLFDKRTIRRGPTLFGENRGDGKMKILLAKLFFSIVRKAAFSAGVVLLAHLVESGLLTPDNSAAVLEIIQNMSGGDIATGLIAIALILVPALWTYVKTLLEKKIADEK